MRMVLDTNVLVSALISPGGLPDQLLQHWDAGDFSLVISHEQLAELRRVLAYDKLKRYIHPEQAAQLVTGLSHLATFAENLPDLDVSTDPSDNVILATAIAGNASHLVTGDKSHLLALEQIRHISIITVREAVELLATQA
jgi:putative PIN family toxin of toxin-antitoxin system